MREPEGQSPSLDAMWRTLIAAKDAELARLKNENSILRQQLELISKCIDENKLGHFPQQ